MKRLTKIYKGQIIPYECGVFCSTYCNNCSVGSGECDTAKSMIERLGAIENILGDNYDLARLRELVEADRDGRCVVLPF